MKKRGFTLTELLVVIAIIAILATVSVVGYTSYINRTYQHRADAEAEQIKKAIEGALIVDEQLYLGTSDGSDCYFSKQGLRIDGVITSEETTLTSLAGDLSHLVGTLAVYPNGNFRWTTEDGAVGAFKIEVDMSEPEVVASDLQEYLDNYFRDGSKTECLLGFCNMSMIYIDRAGLVKIETPMYSSYIPYGEKIEIHTDVNPDIYAITSALTINSISEYVFLTSDQNVQYIEAFLTYGENGYACLGTEKGKEALKMTIEAESLSHVLLGNSTEGKLYIDRWSCSVGQKDAQGNFTPLNGQIELLLDEDNSTHIYGKIYVGVDSAGKQYVRIENGHYTETIYLSTLNQ